MCRFLIRGLLAAGLLAACTGDASSPERELEELLQILPGSYTGTAPVPGAVDGSTQVIHHKIAPVDAPQFGTRVFYYQLSTGGPDGAPLQQKIFVFDTRPARESNRMRAWIFAPGQVAANLERRPAEWPALDPAAMLSFPDACAFQWSDFDDGFAATVSRDTCTFESRSFGQPVSPDMRYAVFAERFEWQETLYGGSGQVLASTGGNLVAERQRRGEVAR